ncbi:hypothetical protein ACLB2K_063544 [Fragaria x ananassa]
MQHHPPRVWMWTWASGPWSGLILGCRLQFCGLIAFELVSRFDESSASLLLQLEDLMMRQAGTRSKPSWSLSVRSQAMMQICWCLGIDSGYWAWVLSQTHQKSDLELGY